ncbi:MAG: ABC transporter permease [Pyrinomonadaceae bacterium]|nr:ABC transporter permease [Pyrinomonadaceae bacterium]
MNVTTGKTPLTLQQAASEETVSHLPYQPLDKPLVLSGEPLVVIEPTKSWVALGLRDLWAYRELLYFLIWRDVKVRYKQTALGILWVVLQPLLTTLILTIFLGKLARVPSDGIPYPLFVYAGLLSWTFFSAAVTSSGNSLVGSAHLITKVYFPRMIIPGAAVGARLVDFGIAFLNLIVLMIYYGVGVTKAIFILPLLILLVTLLTLGIGMWTSALNVKYRDVGVVLPVFMQLWMFASPVIYPSSIVPQKYQWIYNLNPLTGILDGFRSALFGQEINWDALSISTGFTIALLVYSAYAFRRMEKNFADIV